MGRAAAYHLNSITARNDWDVRICLNKKRRKAELRKRTAQVLFAVCFVCIILLGVNRIISKAGTTKEEELSFKYYKSISVQEGDTLTSIAKVYADEEHYSSVEKYVQEVMYINHLKNADKICAGDYLIVPYFSDEFLQ